MAAYAIVPFSSAALASAIHSLPFAVIVFGKAAIAFPFAYHTMNGIRHLVFDSQLSKSTQLDRSGIWASN
jgi:succinate dehydrogenase (ubiquinone) cytochrome b560 subunit